MMDHRLGPAATFGDVLTWPVLGRYLRWRHARRVVQVALLSAAVLVVAHGLFGPQLAPRNLGSVLTWVHYRGLLIVALLVAANVFCMGCPFILVRDAARRLHQPRRAWPRVLRTKWIGIGLLVAVLFAYELFDLWALPRATAWLVLAYFASAVAVDLVFAGAGFCKYVCPLGQFNFTASALSPLEVRVRDAATCSSCRTADCVRGRREPDRPEAIVRRGCELDLFLPAKVGNADCTFCLDCVQACPHDNVAIAVRAPATELADDRTRSSIGRLSTRPDLAVLAVLFSFAAVLNAFAMTAPVYELERWVARTVSLESESAVLGLVFAGALVMGPLLLVGGASAASVRLGSRVPGTTAGAAFCRFAHVLVPVGCAVWLAHYGFHLLTGAWTVVPVAQSAAADLVGWPVLGDPLWTWVGMRPGAVLPLQLGVLVVGASGSVALALAIAERHDPGAARRVALPWALLVILLAVTSGWVFLQPMEMRGTSFERLGAARSFAGAPA